MWRLAGLMVAMAEEVGDGFGDTVELRGRDDGVEVGVNVEIEDALGRWFGGHGFRLVSLC